ncbi:MAG: hypothetical protein QOH15_3196 [Gaiellales bacterium]|nr:hypothetical protein [Gaiellales bacterium]
MPPNIAYVPIDNYRSKRFRPCGVLDAGTIARTPSLAPRSDSICPRILAVRFARRVSKRPMLPDAARTSRASSTRSAGLRANTSIAMFDATPNRSTPRESKKRRTRARRKSPLRSTRSRDTPRARIARPTKMTTTPATTNTPPSRRNRMPKALLTVNARQSRTTRRRDGILASPSRCSRARRHSTS